MKLLHLSDTHGRHRQLPTALPEADVLVHSGDFCMAGTEDEALDFLNWFCDLPYKHKVFICGNHDDCLFEAEISGLDANVHYLCHSSVEIEGLCFHGVPMFTEDCITRRQSENISTIPLRTDVLVTHTPAYGILDTADRVSYGSEELLARIALVRPRLHLFGHIHEQHGILSLNDTVFSNGAIMNADYTDFYRPNLIEI